MVPNSESREKQLSTIIHEQRKEIKSLKSDIKLLQSVIEMKNIIYRDLDKNITSRILKNLAEMKNYSSHKPNIRPR